MACFNGSAGSVLELVKGVVTFLTTAANFEVGKNWTLLAPASIDAITEDTGIILKGVGDGSDEIYVGMKIAVSGTNVNILLNGYAGYDPGLSWFEQPGGITLAKVPAIPLVADTYMTYWLTANSRRFVLVVELSTQYECGYLGLMQPIAIEKQYPYPLVVAGSGYDGLFWTDTSTNHSAFTCPGTGTSTSLAIRRPDGTWRYGKNETLGDLCVWPTNVSPIKTLTVLDDTLTLENVIMYPFYLYENNPVGMIGQLDGVYWIGNREDLSAKDTIMYNNQPYKVFNNVDRRANDSYFAIQWY
jgi:hypothetical protein